MNDASILMDPTGESAPAQRTVRQRPANLQGLTIGLLDIAKPRGDVFIDRLEQLFSQQGLEVKRYRKPTNTKPAPVELKQKIAAQCQVVVEALSD